jgi:hypothetical protein
MRTCYDCCHYSIRAEYLASCGICHDYSKYQLPQPSVLDEANPNWTESADRFADYILHPCAHKEDAVKAIMIRDSAQRAHGRREAAEAALSWVNRWSETPWCAITKESMVKAILGTASDEAPKAKE